MCECKKENETMITIDVNINCAYRPCEPIRLLASATGRDLYLKVSEKTNLSRNHFKLILHFKLIHDSLLPLSEYGIVSHSRITLIPSINSGKTSTNFNQLDAARRAIRDYAFSLPVSTVQGFFEAEEQLRVRIPVGRQWGTLKFKLDNPLPEQSIRLAEEKDMYSDMSILHNVKHPDERTYIGKFSGSLTSDNLDSRGVPSRTVDTIVNMLDNLLNTCGL